MLSAHAPHGYFPAAIKLWARQAGATAQVAGGVPAMCDGVTQGQAGMDLSLFSRDTVARSTAVVLRHAMLFAEGKVGREALLEAENASPHDSGNCTF